MKRFSSRGIAFTMLTLFSLGASTLLTGCFEKEDSESCSPKGGTCDTAATVVDLSTTTGCGLALRLADSTYVVPTGSTWTNFNAKAGDKLLVGYTTKKHRGTQNSCAAGPLVELGCISADTTSTPAN
ncbi:hypothetical protein [Hymenobacter sp. GOD-10R]|uniref:hypothetical protein n=1 Tax=Hymenobacter sp. GOD-10R TaxID=3093922 RepID=UPI002D76F2F7|nr:hypothetical protein [Hymenobacter sp. GOD-10R]WRQ31707.1 hypothetical protein SD425_28765 [Hymenobacter sp. GOD-10R]